MLLGWALPLSASLTLDPCCSNLVALQAIDAAELVSKLKKLREDILAVVDEAYTGG